MGEVREHVEELEVGRIKVEEAARLRADLAKLPLFSGLGLFTVERSTLTSMLSIAVTYLIILVQFKLTLQ